jgi:hypothetical protein
MTRIWLLGLIVALASCISSDPGQSAPSESWNIESEEDQPVEHERDESNPEDDPLVFLPEETSHGNEFTTSGVTHAIRIAFRARGELKDLIVEDGAYRSGTIITIAFPSSEQPEPRTFHVVDREEWFRLHNQGSSWYWPGAWDGVDVYYDPRFSLLVNIAWPEDVARQANDANVLPSHPLGESPEVALRRISGTIRNEALGIHIPFEASIVDLSHEWTRATGTLLQINCPLRIGQSRDQIRTVGVTCYNAI